MALGGSCGSRRGRDAVGGRDTRPLADIRNAGSCWDGGGVENVREGY